MTIPDIDIAMERMRENMGERIAVDGWDGICSWAYKGCEGAKKPETFDKYCSKMANTLECGYTSWTENPNQPIMPTNLLI